jgi:hypothetical protein
MHDAMLKKVLQIEALKAWGSRRLTASAAHHAIALPLLLGFQAGWGLRTLPRILTDSCACFCTRPTEVIASRISCCAGSLIAGYSSTAAMPDFSASRSISLGLLTDWITAAICS